MVANLRFVPDGNEYGSPYSFVGFAVSDGIDYSAANYVLIVDTIPVNDAPVATNDKLIVSNGNECRDLGGDIAW